MDDFFFFFSYFVIMKRLIEDPWEMVSKRPVLSEM